jgi:hypothetical protein
MAHRTLIGGTAYSITGGKSMVSGTSYSIAGGRTLIGGTGYDISFNPKTYAMLYSDGYMVFQRGNEVAEGKTLSNSWTGFEDTVYGSYSSVPWYSEITSVKNVSFVGEIAPKSLAYWFSNARNLISVDYSGLDLHAVTNMVNTYYLCSNLTGSPVCGNKVTNMYSTYYNCSNLTGSPVCGNNVTNMVKTYYFCYNLTGSPVCGEKVTNMVNTYYNCYNLTGNAYFYSMVVANVQNCFHGRNNSSALNIYVKNGSTTHATLLTTNAYSLVGTAITWTDAGTYVYNATYNIFIHPVEDVEIARLNVEYSHAASFSSDNSNGIAVSEDMAKVKTEWCSAAVASDIDSGQLFVMDLTSLDLTNVTIEKAEVS